MLMVDPPSSDKTQICLGVEMVLSPLPLGIVVAWGSSNEIGGWSCLQ
jgi:hypothetical protein